VNRVHEVASLEQLAITPDSGTIATSHAGQHVLLWDAQGEKVAEQVGQGQRKPAWVKERATYRIGSLALSANGRWLAYSGQEQGIVLVDARSGRELGARSTPLGLRLCRVRIKILSGIVMSTTPKYPNKGIP
jgi:hypothetical protein